MNANTVAKGVVHALNSSELHSKSYPNPAPGGFLTTTDCRVRVKFFPLQTVSAGSCCQPQSLWLAVSLGFILPGFHIESALSSSFPITVLKLHSLMFALYYFSLLSPLPLQFILKDMLKKYFILPGYWCHNQPGRRSRCNQNAACVALLMTLQWVNSKAETVTIAVWVEP